MYMNSCSYIHDGYMYMYIYTGDDQDSRNLVISRKLIDTPETAGQKQVSLPGFQSVNLTGTTFGNFLRPSTQEGLR